MRQEIVSCSTNEFTRNPAKIVAKKVVPEQLGGAEYRESRNRESKMGYADDVLDFCKSFNFSHRASLDRLE